MGNSKNSNVIFSLRINYGKRVTREIQSSGAIAAAGPAMGRFKNPIDHLVEFIHKSFRSPRTALPIPTRRSLSLFDGGRVQAEILCRHSMAEESLRRASSRKTRLTFPESRSSMRRTISASQAA